MLAKANRVTLAADYRTTIRRGRRFAGATLVTHVVKNSGGGPVRCGFVVSKKVGVAVTRNTVRRRLKAVCHDLLDRIDPGTDIVFRALPAAALADYGTLHAEVLDSLSKGKVIR